MSSQYRKIKYEIEGPYGTTEDRYLYIWSHATVDVVHVFDDTGKELFCFSETGFDMGSALAVAFSNWNDSRMEKLEHDDFKLINRE
jgi:hypothetical protein